MVSTRSYTHKAEKLIRSRVEDAPLAMVYPKKAFMTGALEKEIRLSFAQRIRGTLPEPYHPLISEAKEKDRPDFKYESDRMFAPSRDRTEAC